MADSPSSTPEKPVKCFRPTGVLEHDLQRAIGDEQIGIDDADEIRNFASFLDAAGSAGDRATPEGRQRFRDTYRDHYPKDYERAMAQHQARQEGQQHG